MTYSPYPFWQAGGAHPNYLCLLTNTNVQRIRNCRQKAHTCSEPMTSHARDAQGASGQPAYAAASATCSADVMATILKVWHEIKNPTDSVNSPYLLVVQSCQISSRSDLKWRNLGLFWRAPPQQPQWDKYMKSASDKKIHVRSTFL